jgi:maltose O-acetyltransferase
MRTEKEKMLAGELYHAGDPKIQADQAAAKVWMVRYNASLAGIGRGKTDTPSRTVV